MAYGPDVMAFQIIVPPADRWRLGERLVKVERAGQGAAGAYCPTVGEAHNAHNPGFSMRFNQAVRKCVVFLGSPDYEAGQNAIRCAGTGFLILYKGGFHLITARHVAEALGDIGWGTRVNKKDGTSQLIEAENVPWVFHPDDTVDVAVCGLSLSARDGFDFIYADGEVRKEEETTEWVEVGDICYTVGLWRLLEGKERNLPVVHTGNIARLPGEEGIPVRAPKKPGGREMVDGYLIEAQTLSGLSGSPVFVRPSCSVTLRARNEADPPDTPETPLPLVGYRESVRLIGLWQAAWDASAGEVLTAEHGPWNYSPRWNGNCGSYVKDYRGFGITGGGREARKAA